MRMLWSRAEGRLGQRIYLTSSRCAENLPVFAAGWQAIDRTKSWAGRANPNDEGPYGFQVLRISIQPGWTGLRRREHCKVKKVIVPTDVRKEDVYHAVSRHHRDVTLLACVSAAGDALTPILIIGNPIVESR
jgi:hypothetical protein